MPAGNRYVFGGAAPTVSTLTLLRHFNRLLRRIYGLSYRKTYANMYEGGRLRKRRVYRVPRAEEVERAMELAQAGISRVG